MLCMEYTKLFKPVLFVVLFMGCFTLSSQAQTPALDAYNQTRQQITKIGMITLGSWAIGNMALNGGLMLNRERDQRYYFYQMNVFWNVVNLGLAGFSFLSLNEPGGLSLYETLQEQNQLEKILLFNAGLDLGYMATGLYLRELGNNRESRRNQWRGYGNALILQGGFLFVFDVALATVLNQHADNLSPFFQNVSLSPAAFSIKIPL